MPLAEGHLDADNLTSVGRVALAEAALALSVLEDHQLTQDLSGRESTISSDDLANQMAAIKHRLGLL